MKKLFTLLIIAAFAASCEGPMGPMGPQGPAGQDGTVSKKEWTVTVEPSDWKPYLNEVENFIYFYADKGLSGFTGRVFDSGLYYAYWKYDDNYVLVQEGLGVTMELEWYNESDQKWYAYTEVISCSFSEGSVRFQLSRSDFDDTRPTATLAFRIIALY